MNKQHKEEKTKAIIIILAVLLGMSITALTGMLIYNHFTEKQPVSVIVPENIITPETDEYKPGSEISDTDSTDAEPNGTSSSESKTDSDTQKNSTSEKSTGSANTGSTNADKTATAPVSYTHLDVYKRQV